MTATSHRPRLLALAALAVALAAALACPLPQPLPGVTRIDGGTITPPRIQVSTVSHPDTVVYYDPAACKAVGALGFNLMAILVDQNSDEVVDVRWFVDYVKGDFTMTPWADEQIPPPVDPEQFQRGVTPRLFNPATDPWTTRSGPPHVVELVVTNGGFGDDPLPKRSPFPGYEVEVFRWVFYPSPSPAGCGP